MSENKSTVRSDESLGETFVEAELGAYRLMARARIITVTILIVFMALQFRNLQALFWIGFLFLGGLTGWMNYRLRRRLPRAEWITIVFFLSDALLVTASMLIPNPFVPEPWPIQMKLRFHSFPFFYVLLGLVALTYSPRLVVWMGGFVALAWGAGIAMLLALPSSRTYLDFENMTTGPSGAAKLDFALQPTFVSIAQPIQDVVLLLVVAGILAAAVWRSKRLVERQVVTARERANLSRYFSPTMIDELAGMDEPLGAVRSQKIAVLFADIVGFTTLSEKEPPEKVIGLLRDFHGRMAREVFAHGGTVDKYIGDAIMATFGTPRPGPNDATSALACARAMVDTIGAWNAERIEAGEEPVKVGIGLHFGPAVMGDIGDERRLEFAVIGDTVNVASRLEALTRDLEAPLVVSDDAVEAVRREDGGGAVNDLKKAPAASVRGRASKIGVWTLDPASAPA